MDRWHVTLAPPRREAQALLALTAARFPAVWPRWVERVPQRGGGFVERVTSVGRYILVRYDDGNPGATLRVWFLVAGPPRDADSPVVFRNWFRRFAVGAPPPGYVSLETMVVSDREMATITSRMLNDDGLMPLRETVDAPAIGRGDVVEVGGPFTELLAGRRAVVRWATAAGAHVDLAGGAAGLFRDGLFVPLSDLVLVEAAPRRSDRSRSPQFGRRRAA